MLGVLINIGKTLGKKFGAKATQKAAQEIVNKFAAEVTVQGGTMLDVKRIEKVFLDTMMSYDEKVKQLKKLKDNQDITVDEYEKIHRRLIDAHFEYLG